MGSGSGDIILNGRKLFLMDGFPHVTEHDLEEIYGDNLPWICLNESEEDLLIVSTFVWFNEDNRGPSVQDYGILFSEAVDRFCKTFLCDDDDAEKERAGAINALKNAITKIENYNGPTQSTL